MEAIMFEKTEQQNIFDAVHTQIETAKKDGWNLLLPSFPISPTPESLFVPCLEKVEIDTADGSKDIYKGAGSTKFRLHAAALNRIAIAGELKWNNDFTGYAKDQDGTQIFRAVGGVVNSAGNIHQESGYYPLNLADIKDDLIDQYTEKAKKDGKDQSYIDYCVNRDYRAKRQHLLKLTETGAKNRVIRKIFNIKNEYTLAELKKPFLVLKFTIYMDFKDPMVKQMVLGMKIQAALGVYGVNNTPSLPSPQNFSIPAPKAMEPFDPDNDPNLTPVDDDLTEQEEELSSAEFDFINADKETQDIALKTLADKVKVTLKDMTFPDNITDKRLYAFRQLNKKLISDEIPF